MNLSMNNTYFNSINEVFLGPIKIYDYEENELWYSPPENEFFRELDSIKISVKISFNKDRNKQTSLKDRII